MLQLKLPSLKRIEAITRQFSDGISFSQGALRTGGVPQEIRSYAQHILKTDTADYYQHVLGIMPLREKIALTLSAQQNVKLTAAHIMISHGSIGALAAMCLALLELGDEVILPEPTYPVYENVIACAKGVPRFVPAYQEHDGRWFLDVDRVIASITPKTKMVVFPNPSNPLGVCVHEKELDRLANDAQQRGYYLVVDEVYDYYLFDDALASATTLIPFANRVVRLGSFSKNFAMSGWRVGYMVADPALIEQLAPVQDALLCCPTVISQYAAMYALDHPDLMESSKIKVKTGRDLTIQALTPFKAQGLLHFTTPPAGFYLFVKTNLVDTEFLVFDVLEKKHIGLVPGKEFGPRGGPYMRICFAREPEITREGMRRLSEYLSAPNPLLAPHNSSTGQYISTP